MTPYRPSKDEIARVVVISVLDLVLVAIVAVAQKVDLATRWIEDVIR